MDEQRSEQREMLTFHLLSTTWSYHSKHVVLFGSLSVTPPYSSSYFPSFLPSSILAFLPPPLFWLTLSALHRLPPHPLPCYHLSTIPPSFQLSLFLTSCSPVYQTVIINRENDSPPGPWEPSTLAALRNVCVFPLTSLPPDLAHGPAPLNASLCSASEAWSHPLQKTQQMTYRDSQTHSDYPRVIMHTLYMWNVQWQRPICYVKSHCAKG